MPAPVIAAFCIGFAGCIVQLVLLREIFAAFGGSEQTTALVLGAWLLCFGLGAVYSAQKCNKKTQPVLRWLVFMAAWTALSVPVLRFLRVPVFGAGIAAAPLSVFWFSALGSAPLCFAGGVVLTRLARIIGLSGSARVYSADTLGAIAAGLLFSFVGSTYLSHSIAIEISGLFILAAALLMRQSKKEILVAIAALCFATGLVANTFPASLTALFAGQTVTNHFPSPQGMITRTEYNGQTSFYANGHVLDFGNTIESAEEKGHLPAILAKPNGHFLLVGGTGAKIAHLLAHNPARIDFVAPDQKTAKLYSQQIAALKNKAVHILYGDAVLFALTGSFKTKYDAICLDISEPQTIASARFYTSEVLQLFRKALKTDGIFITSLPITYDSYINPQTLLVLQNIHASLQSVFNHVDAIAGRTFQFVAGPQKININGIIPALGQSAPDAIWANTHGWGTWFTAHMQDEINILFTETAHKQPTELTSLAVLKNAIQAKNSLFNDSSSFPALAVFLLALGLILIGRPWYRRTDKTTAHTTLYVAASGFLGSVGFVIALVCFQIIAAAMFRWTGAFTALYMAGLAIGAWCVLRKPCSVIANLPVLVILQAVTIPFTIAGLLLAFKALYFGCALLGFGCFACGLLGGMVFAVAEQKTKHNTNIPKLVFAADFAGGTTGMLASGLWIVYSANMAVAIGFASLVTLLVLGITMIGKP